MERICRGCVDKWELNLAGLVVLTEAGTGPYIYQPILAAMAGAKVLAVVGDSMHGGVEYVKAECRRVAANMGYANVVSTLMKDMLWAYDFSAVDIVTNSGHVRPIGSMLVAKLKETAVVPLMYETWEYNASQVDLVACREYGVLVMGTDEYFFRDYFNMEAARFIRPAVLGPLPILDLYAAGLKVGEAMARARLDGKGLAEAASYALTMSPAQDFKGDLSWIWGGQ